MKKYFRFLLVVGILSTSFSQAQEYKAALGIRLSSAQATVNNGLSFRYFLNEKSAIEAIVSFDPAALGGLYERFSPLGAPGLQWYYGGGAYAAIDDVNTVGLMGVIGLDYKFQQVPINLSVDWKPELNLVRTVSFEAATVGLSIRFVFPSKKKAEKESAGGIRELAD